MTLNCTGSDAEAPLLLYGQYDVIVFDCDGVILDSNDFKSEVFRQVLAAHDFPPSEIEAFSIFQKNNFGTSRYRLFQALVDGQFGPCRDVTCDALLTAFGEMCLVGYLEQAETPGLRSSLDLALMDGRALYIVSGSDEGELRHVLNARGLGAYFKAIYGSPRTKGENMQIIKAMHPPKTRYLFVGDAEADMAAAEGAGADFVFMARYSKVKDSLEAKARAAGYPVINDLGMLA